MGLQAVWSWLPAIYLFVGGLGAGTFCVVALIGLLTGDRFKSTVRFGAWASAGAIAFGSLILLLDVGVPFRAMVLYRSFVNPDSWMAIGAWLLFAAILVNGLYALAHTDRMLTWLLPVLKPFQTRLSAWQRLIAVIGIPLNLGVATYTGILLGSLPFRPFWNTWLLPALFVASALDTGVGLVTVYVALVEKGEGVSRLRRVLEILILILVSSEGVVLGYYLQSMLGSSADAARAAQIIVSGPASPLFWVAVVGLGLAVPLLVSLGQLSGVSKRAKSYPPVVAATSCLVGGLALRLVVLLAGLPATLSSPALIQILTGVRFSP